MMFLNEYNEFKFFTDCLFLHLFCNKIWKQVVMEYIITCIGGQGFLATGDVPGLFVEPPLTC